MKECEVELTQKGDMVARLQVKASQIGKLLQTLEKSDENSKKAQTLSKQKSETAGPPTKKPHYIDPIPPFNANKIRKSPSATLPNETQKQMPAPSTSNTQIDLKSEAEKK